MPRRAVMNELAIITDAYALFFIIALAAFVATVIMESF
jgi:hypothetical protein